VLAKRVQDVLGSLREVLRLVWAEADGFVKRRLVYTLLLITAASGMTALGPVALKLVVDGFAGQAKGQALSAVLLIGLYVFSQWLARTVGEIRSLVYAGAERRMMRTLSERVFAFVMYLPLRFHLERQTGAINQVLQNGQQGFQMISHTLVFTLLPVATELTTIVVVLHRLGQPAFLSLFCGAIVLYAATFTYAAATIRTEAKSASAAQVAANAVMTDAIINYETVKYFTAESVVQERVGRALVETEHGWVSFYRRYAYNGLYVATIFATFLAVTIMYAAHEVQAGRMTIGTFVMINTYMLQIVRPVEMLGYAMQSLSQGMAYLEKMIELFREKTEPMETTAPNSRVVAHPTPLPQKSSSPTLLHDDGEGGSEGRTSTRTILHPHPLHRVERVAAKLADEEIHGERRGEVSRPGEVIFDNVSLSYRPERKILDNVSFRLPAGKTLGIVGGSGAGKSTLVRLMVRLMEPDEGRVLLDGVAVSELPLSRLRGSIAVVPQDTILFNDTIGYNIAFGKAGSTQEDVVQAAKVAHLHDFIMRLPEGYDTKVGERGIKLSGGEKQRVSIARAAIKRPRIYIFDEATSSLDSHTESEILRALREISKTTTTIVIAHRLSTVVHADEIAVLDEGTIIERGTHTSLLRQNGRYAKLWQAQQHGTVAA
jgi:ABC-type transport system involved in Fe-S cluster assembly fused permease/ATPase subunit